VFLADDYPGIVAAVARLLAPTCDVVGHVVTGVGLLEAVAHLQPDVMVVDVHLPGMNGLEACRRIRESSLNAAVVVISAATDAELQSAALAAGASAFINKYKMADELEAAVRQAFCEASASEGPDLLVSWVTSVRDAAVARVIRQAWPHRPSVRRCDPKPHGAIIRSRFAEGVSEAHRIPSRAIRALVEAILLEPDGERLKITLKGDLAGILSAARDTKRSPDTGDLID
jgi:DNA-binding NarL/FixJ family response regulator